MPTIISHAVAAVALITAFPVQAVPRRLMLLGAGCSMVPDLDVIGFRFGVQYGDLLGHRGLSHSLAFAGVLASLALFATLPRLGSHAHRGVVWLYLFFGDHVTRGTRRPHEWRPRSRIFFSVRYDSLLFSTDTDCCFSDRSTLLFRRWLIGLVLRVLLGVASIHRVWGNSFHSSKPSDSSLNFQIINRDDL